VLALPHHLQNHMANPFTCRKAPISDCSLRALIMLVGGRAALISATRCSAWSAALRSDSCICPDPRAADSACVGFRECFVFL
jgi:hypothetical protein